MCRISMFTSSTLVMRDKRSLIYPSQHLKAVVLHSNEMHSYVSREASETTGGTCAGRRVIDTWRMGADSG